MTTILNGLLGGAIVGVVATLTARLASGVRWGQTAGSGTESTASRWKAYLSAVAYGTAAGGALLALELYVLGVLAVPPSVGEAFAVAVAWSAALLVAVLAVWRFALRSRLNRSRLRGLVAYHAVFGVGFGLWIRLSWIT